MSTMQDAMEQLTKGRSVTIRRGSKRSQLLPTTEETILTEGEYVLAKVGNVGLVARVVATNTSKMVRVAHPNIGEEIVHMKHVAGRFVC